MNLIDYLEKDLKKILKKLGYETSSKLMVSRRPDLGHYQYNGAFSIAKTEKENPKILADNIIAALEKSGNYKEISNAGGFINLTINDNLLVKFINDLHENININIPKYENKTIMIDYGGANIAKELHVGHLRSANIGEALKRLFNLVGFKTISDVHLGDFGRPMGLIIKEIKEMHPDLSYFKDVNNLKDESPIESVDELNRIYPLASEKASIDEDYLNDARKITSELQKGHKGYTALWKKIYDLSVSDIKIIYDKLNASFDLWEGESDAEKYIPEMMDYLNKNNLTEKSEGAVIIDVKKEDDKREVPPVILIKSDGGLLYDTTELATLYSRVKNYNPDYIIYLTDKRQELHFVSTFRAGYKTKIVPEDTILEHIGFGTINGKDGKPFKTRDGKVLSLNELIEMVKVEVKKFIKDNISDKETLAEKLAIATIKYGDLLPNPSSDYIFDPKIFSDLNGKTGIYLLYSTIRMKSLLENCFKHDIKPLKYHEIYSEEEKEIILNLLKVKNIISQSVENRSLNEIAEYLYNLTGSFNSFYGKYEIIKNKDKLKKESWATLTKIIYDTNVLLLNTLGIDIPDKI